MSGITNQKANIIGIAGKMQAGKDSVANIIINKYNTFSKKSLAYPIKLIAYISFGIPIEKSPNKEIYNKQREIWQLIGTEIGRRWEEDMWLKRLLSDFEMERKGTRSSVIVIPDIRFDNEADACDLIIKVNRNNTISNGIQEHASEKGISENILKNKNYIEINNNFNSLVDLENSKEMEKVFNKINETFLQTEGDCYET